MINIRPLYGSPGYRKLGENPCVSQSENINRGEETSLKEITAQSGDNIYQCKLIIVSHTPI